MSKHYLISGAGSGIGLAMAKELAKDGSRIILLGRNKEHLERAKSSLTGSNHRVLVADITSKIDLAEAAESIKDIRLNGIIANAGVGGENQRGKNDRWNEIIDTNLSGTYHFINAFLPALEPGPVGYSHIIMISSVLARLGVPHYTAYCASKAGLLGMMRSLAVELAPKRMLVNAVCPGWVDTDMARSGMEMQAQHLKIGREQFYEMAMQAVPLRKMSKPEEIAQLCAYLMHQESITGQALDINNGAVMNS
jgi:NAD(P)-dependent dehydrogenase (short-subunit alcohol dehydrogenase family)